MMKAKEFVPTSKPRNFVAKNAMKTTSGAGVHRDKKHEKKKGYEKHKGKNMEEDQKTPFAGASVGHKEGPEGQWRNKGPKAKKPAKPGDLVGG